jgi:hypothetical protein
MDLRAFRGGSDFSVAVGGELFRLHKFPLYAKCAYFKTLEAEALAQPGTTVGPDRVDLAAFPGGAQAFALAADFCYGIDLNITADNIAQLCCSAEYLEMSGRGNLIEAVMTYLQESGTLDSSEACLILLADCLDLWPTAPKTKILEKLLSTTASNFALYPAVTRLPLDWFVRLIVAARGKGSMEQLLTQVCVYYLLDWLSEDAHLAPPLAPEAVHVHMDTVVGLMTTAEGMLPTEAVRLLKVSWDYTIACKPTLIGFVCDLIYVLRVDHLVGLVPELVIEVATEMAARDGETPRWVPSSSTTTRW